MKWIIKYCLTCTFLLGIFSTNLFSVESIFNLPDSLMNVGNWQEARIELEKIYFFSSNEEIKTEALIKKANCFKQEKEFEKEIQTLNRIFLYNQNDSIYFLVKYEKALGYYLNEVPGMAIAELQSIKNIHLPSEQSNRYYLLSTLCNSEMHYWDNAKKMAEEYLGRVCSDTLKKIFYQKKVDSLFRKENIPNFLSPQKAKNMSTYLPGSGQFYTGRIGEGLLSFSLHGVLLYFGIQQFSNKFYFTGYTAGFGLLQRIHSGNLQRVQNLVEENNKKKETEFSDKLLNILFEAAI